MECVNLGKLMNKNCAIILPNKTLITFKALHTYFGRLPRSIYLDLRTSFIHKKTVFETKGTFVVLNKSRLIWLSKCGVKQKKVNEIRCFVMLLDCPEYKQKHHTGAKYVSQT
ncbi:hypothetical protein EGR_07214 [Echinococcus granulosus]|uniref:Uncharacterized protein n=1 Tax=Echinococcus granulosus TaxID=6210 RepID=W6UWU5_ECHGR|nr:hypothetical protein EGR_07214 [Echinococcus granulosus]EUB57944.1 hypothetical protein EGR_07214 [Echinococcus granulosus]